MRTLATLAAMAFMNDSLVQANQIHHHGKNHPASLLQLSTRHSNRLDVNVHRHHHASGMDALDARIKEV